MVHALSARRLAVGFGLFIEHAAVVFVGFVMMVVGLALGVTMIMLPAGIVIGLLGVLMVIGGVFGHFDHA